MTSRVKIAAGFLAIYLAWGSTYLAVRLAIETVPPFLMVGMRSLIAGLLLCALAHARGASLPTRAEWRGALIVGLLFFVGCHGLLAWAQRGVETGFAALMLATVPLWVPLLDWLRGARPTGRVVVALAIGFMGVALLIGASRGLSAAGSDPLAVTVLLVSALSWALGSVLARALALPKSVTQAAGLELLLGGAVLLCVSAASGELADFDAGAVSLRSALAIAWLAAVGSVLGFTVYGWLLRVAPPARVATYAYVNPVVAMALGWWLLGEPVTVAMLVASGLILAAVVVALADRPLGSALRQLPSRLARFVLTLG
jgi:drug/metabolite transporter (DMT)-like permease